MSQYPLHRAAATGDVETLAGLLANGVNIEERDGNGATPLWADAFKGQVGSIEFLITRGANVNAGNDVKYTPLMAAAREKKPAAVEALLRAHADLNARAESGHKALHWLMFDTVPNKKGRSYGTEHLVIEILEVFKKYGADLDMTGSSGNTPLMDAAWWALPDVVAFLICQGANPAAKDNEGKTAADFARLKLAKHFDSDMDERCEKIIQMLSKDNSRPRWKFW